jgi:uncharacterized LabA/DUF88 family protein
MRNAVFVDAGYVFAQGSVSVAGTKIVRPNIKLDEAEIINQLKSLAFAKSGGAALLRIYWYDGAKNGPTVEHIALANMEDVKVRLGFINSAGMQKGVDSLLVTDLIDLARNQAISDALVITGDGDLRIAVQIAQSFGVRVHLVGLEPCHRSQSQQLRQEADTTHEISKTDIAKFITITQSATQPPTIGPTATTIAGVTPALSDFDKAVTQSIQKVLGPLDPSDIKKLAAAIGVGDTVPSQYDGKLLGSCRGFLGRDLSGDERRQMRNTTIEYIKKG